MRIISLPILSLSVLAFVALPAPAGQPDRDLVRAFLRDSMGFSAGEIEDVRAGRAVARQMKTRDAVDVNIFGAVRINAPVESFVRQIREIDVFERGAGILQVGKFHDPPQLSDLNALTLEKSDLAALPDCQPTDCGLQLPAPVMARFRSGVNWRAPDAREWADRLFRQWLFEQLQTYRSGGTAALAAYDDREKPMPLAAEFRLLTAPGDMPAPLHELTHYVTNYPKAALPGASDIFYWNKGEFGLKPTIRLNHLVIYPTAGPAVPPSLKYIVATKQVYSNHYFSTTLELRSLVDDAERPGQGFYLLYTTKSRVSGLTGFMGTLIRSLVKSRARSGMESYMEFTKKKVEGR